MTGNQLRPLTTLTLLAAIFSLLVVGLGAYTRLVHAGLGCPDWPTCYGHLWAPGSTIEIANANNDFPDTPVNLEKTWPEMTHRYLASALGLLCIAICFISVRSRRKIKSFPYRHSLGLLALIILQGMFGMWTVTLKLWPQVVTLHLLGGFTTFGLLLLLYLRLAVAGNARRNIASNGPQKLALVVLIAVIIQVLLGGWTSSNYAALACLELPLCSVNQLTGDDFSQGFNLLQQIGPNYLGGQLDGGARVAIHATHRFGALVLAILALMLIIRLYRSRYVAFAIGLASMLALQLGLGISNVYFHLPLYNAVAHNIGGALLLAVLIVINFGISLEQRQRV